MSCSNKPIARVRCKHHFQYLNSRVLLQGSVVNSRRARNMKAEIMKSYVGQAEIAQVWKTSWKVLKSREKNLKTNQHSAAQSLNHARLTAAVMLHLATIRIHTFFIFPLIIRRLTVLILLILWRSQYMRWDFFGTKIHVCSTAYPGKPAIRC